MSSKPIALVTGANRGIGLAVASTLAADGFHVVIGTRSGDAIAGFDCVQLERSSEIVNGSGASTGERGSQWPW